jgi:hypothetical protein
MILIENLKKLAIEAQNIFRFSINILYVRKSTTTKKHIAGIIEYNDLPNGGYFS